MLISSTELGYFGLVSDEEYVCRFDVQKCRKMRCICRTQPKEITEGIAEKVDAEFGVKDSCYLHPEDIQNNTFTAAMAAAMPARSPISAAGTA